jgi:signal peptidase II
MQIKISNKILNIIFALGAVIILISDQAVKYIIKGIPRELFPISVIPKFLFITRVTNSGAAFGIFPSKTKILIIISIIAIILIIILKIKMPINSFFYNLALGFILGGAIGNLIDRVIIGEVTDYLYVAYFAVFNIADSFIVIGFGIIIVIIIKAFFKKGAI